MEQQSSSQGQLVGQRFGKYDLLALLAIGGTAEIYLARIAGEAGFEKYVVCKCLLDHLADEQDYVRMFLDEARIGAQLDHSNIVQTLELGEQDGRYYMVMEYLAGMSLSTMARRSQERVPGGLPIDLTLCLGAQACAGLHYAHERTSPDGRPLNIIHRDISPQNLVISFEGVLKLVDFGIAKAEMRETHTKSGTIKGKFAYMSPEQCLGHAIDRRTDIFALGTILHELLTGQRLFKRGSTYDTYQAIVKGEVPTPSSINHQLDPQLDEVVMRALAYNRQDRYPTAEAFGESLLQVLHRRGKSISPGDVSRFFDQHFAEEINTHAARMRELITDGRATMDDITWHSTDLVSDSASEMPDDAPEPAAPMTLEDGWDDIVGDTADAEVGGESTRIEPNPLLRVQTMHAQEMKKQRELSGGAVPSPLGKQRSRPIARQADPRGGVGRETQEMRKPAVRDEAPTISGHKPVTDGPPPDARRPPGGRRTLAMPAGGAPMPARPARRPSTVPPPTPRAASQPVPQPMAQPVPQSAPYPQAVPQAQSQPEVTAPGPAPAPAARASTGSEKPAQFPQVHTPTAFRQRAVELIADAPSMPRPGDDLYALKSEPRPGHPPWVFIVAFAVSVCVGLGGTLLVSALF